MLPSLLTWIVILTGLISFAYYRVAPLIWMSVTALILLLSAWYQWISLTSLIVVGVLLVLIALMLAVKPLRLAWLSAPLLGWFRRQQPEISAQEKIVLESGGVWWEQQLLSGSPNWEILHKLPSPSLSAEEQAFIQDKVMTLCGMLNEWEINHTLNDLPETVWNYIKREGFWGLMTAKEYAGHGFSAYAHSTIVSKIASRSPSAAFIVMVPNSVGPQELIAHYGTSLQKQVYLPRLAQGLEVPCFALSELGAGSDAASLKSLGEVAYGEYQGEQVLGIRLQFDKRYITLAPVATLIGLAFHLRDPEHLLSEEVERGISLALIPANLPGVEVGQRHWPANLGFMNGPIRGKNVFIPLGNIIGGEEKIGCGWQMLMESISVGRGISLPALSAAASKLCMRMTANYAVVRQQFSRGIGQFEGVQVVLGRMAAFTFIIEANRRFLALAVDKGAKPAIASAIAKYHMTELCRKVIIDAVDIHAGRGVQLGPHNYLESFLNVIPIMVTVEGANILTRNLIIFGQGIMRCHPFLQKEIHAAFAEDGAEGLIRFDQLLYQHATFTLQQLARAFSAGVSRGRFLAEPTQSDWLGYYQQIMRMAHGLLLVTDCLLLLLGKQFKINEALSARLGDVLSHLFMASAVIKYDRDLGSHQDLKPVVLWSLQYCLYETQRAFVDITDNFPKPWLGKVLRRILFPWGLSYRYPQDKLTIAIAESVQHNDSVRDMLTPYCFTGEHADDPTGLMEAARLLSMQTAPVFAKLAAAVKSKKIKQDLSIEERLQQAQQVGVITEVEREECMQAHIRVMEACAVDEFTRELLQ